MLFFCSVAIGFISVQYVILVFPHERPIFLRETGNNMYSVGPYYLGRFLAEFPAGLIVPVIFSTIIYFAVGLNQTLWWKFPLFCNNLSSHPLWL